MDDIEKLLAISYHPDVQGCLAALEAHAGYKLSPPDRQPFLYFHRYITDPQPSFIGMWRSNPRTEKWYHRLTNGILGDVQNSLACVQYHQEQLSAIELNVMAAIERIDYRKALTSSTMGGGNTLKLDFEYQAFVLAARRTLDYLARAVSAYFKDELHSFRKLEHTLKRFRHDDSRKAH